MRRFFLLTLGLASLWGCGGGPDGPTPPPPPSITCPASVVQGGVTGGGQAITFAPPAASGGSPPVTVTCAPASGAFFSLGTTTVTCIAQDGKARQAACTFTVALSAPTIGALKITAFGDSVTEGQNGREVNGMRVVDVPNAYPTKLQGLFDFEYPGQPVTVFNRGKGSEFLEDAVRRLPGELTRDRPDVLLLLHGYNEMGACMPGEEGTPACATAMTVVVNKLRECIQIAKDPKYGVRYVFVSTLTPPGPVTFKPRARSAAAIVQVNGRIAQMIPAERATLVDPHPLFVGHEAEYVDTDGLHLRPAGNDVLARQFFNAIVAAVPATFR